MDYGTFSMLAMVTAAVIYLFAVFAFAAEWAFARNARTTVIRRRRQRVPVAVGAAGAIDDSRSTDTQDAGTEGDGSTHGEAEGVEGSGPVESARERYLTDLFGRLGMALVVVALLANVTGVVLRGLAADRLPWGNMYEFTTTSLAFVVLAYLVLAARFSMRWLGLPVAMVATIGLGLAVTVFYVDVAPLVPALHSAWFLFHILAATVSGAAFTLGGVASIFYLLRARAEERGEVRGYLAKLPSAAAIDKLAYTTLAFGFPLFTFVIAAGAIWAQYAWGRYWGWDPKETWSLVTWAIYAAYLHARATAGWKGRRAALIAIVGAVSFWWNFVGVNLLVQGLHSYAK